MKYQVYMSVDTLARIVDEVNNDLAQVAIDMLREADSQNNVLEIALREAMRERQEWQRKAEEMYQLALKNYTQAAAFKAQYSAVQEIDGIVHQPSYVTGANDMFSQLQPVPAL